MIENNKEVYSDVTAGLLQGDYNEVYSDITAWLLQGDSNKVYSDVTAGLLSQSEDLNVL